MPLANAPPPPEARPKAKIYPRETIDVTELKRRAVEVLGVVPFQWQLDAAVAILCGEDVILDVGTGSGKSLCFVLALLFSTTDVAITVMPLTALMLEQAQNAKIPTIAICAETIAAVGREKLFEAAAAGAYRHILCSPELFATLEFKQGVVNKLADCLRVVNFDEGHLMTEWGTTFRSEYRTLGNVRGLVPSCVPVMPVSATWSADVLDDVMKLLGLPPTTRRIEITNARPNVALSIRQMKFEERSMADLRFLIPVGARKPEDIPITLVYTNERLKAERACERLKQWCTDEGIEDPEDGACVAFYHAKVGPQRKRELERQQAESKARIWCCTDAAGLGCNMRNVARVVLWEMPPSFCALVQRAGRAARDLNTLGEAILIVTAAYINKGKKELESITAHTVEGAAHVNSAPGDDVDELSDGVDVAEGRQRVLVQEGGVREGNESDEGDGDGGDEDGPKKRVKRGKKKHVWDEFFGNAQKTQLQHGVNTIWKPQEGQRCCYRCSPTRFPIEKIVLDKMQGLKRGRKKEFPVRLTHMLRRDLGKWRAILAEELYPGIEGVTGETVLGDDVIEQLATFGDRIDTVDLLRKCTRWFLAYANDERKVLTVAGQALLTKLRRIYDEFDALGPDALSTGPGIPASLFYGPSTRGGSGGPGSRGTTVPAARGGRGGRGRGTGTRSAGRGNDSGTKSTRGKQGRTRRK
ncbi:hypothetical protein HMN09_00793500 [Mycena chlorophos]|uniref:DNA 3'-5' helicase n=1 Tax=Mycena chlorophos TaxID=658473 RepID=A0A8H6SVG7_MYCCL|nr:hypothetical protein HMN09_00793500 [Mycena chlorophos]